MCLQDKYVDGIAVKELQSVLRVHTTTSDIV